MPTTSCGWSCRWIRWQEGERYVSKEVSEPPKTHNVRKVTLFQPAFRMTRAPRPRPWRVVLSRNQSDATKKVAAITCQGHSEAPFVSSQRQIDMAIGRAILLTLPH